MSIDLTKINTLLADNISREISPEDLRDCFAEVDQAVAGEIETVNQELTARTLVVGTVQELRDLPIDDEVQVAVMTRGTLAVGDGGEGVWEWDAVSTDADNTAVVVLPTGHTEAGRWTRIMEDDCAYLEWWGIQDYPTDNRDAFNAALLWCWQNKVPSLTLKKTRKLALSDCIPCSNITLDLKNSEICPPPTYTPTIGAGTIFGFGDGLNLAAGQVKRNPMNPTTTQLDHRHLHPTSIKYDAGTLFEQFAAGTNYPAGSINFTMSADTALEPGDMVCIFSPIKETVDQATAEFNFVDSVQGSTVTLAFPTTKYHVQDPAFAAGGIARFDTDAVLQDFHLKNVIFPEVQAGANNILLSCVVLRLCYGCSYENVSVFYNTPSWHFLKGTNNYLKRVIFHPKAPYGAAITEDLPNGMGVEQGNANLLVEDSSFINSRTHFGEGSSFHFKRCNFVDPPNLDGSGMSNAGTVNQGANGVFEECSFTNPKIFSCTRVVTRDGHGKLTALRCKATGTLGSYLLLNGNTTPIKGVSSLVIEDCVFDLTLSSALTDSTVIANIHSTGDGLVIINSFLRVASSTQQPIATVNGYFVGGAKPAGEVFDHTLVDYVEESTVNVYGNDIKMTKQHIRWKEAIASDPTGDSFVRNTPGYKIEKGVSPSVVEFEFSIANDHNGPAAFYVVPVFSNPNNSTDTLVVRGSYRAAKWTTPTVLEEATSLLSYAYPLSGKLIEKDIVANVARDATNGLVSSFIHLHFDCWLSTEETTLTSPVYLLGWDVYTVGGR